VPEQLIVASFKFFSKIQKEMKEMADKVQEHDKQVLHKLGYAQELARRMSGFSNFAISFSIICILAGGISAFAAAFNAAGSGGAVIIWLVGGALAMSVAWEWGGCPILPNRRRLVPLEFTSAESFGAGQPPGSTWLD
jgi:hypothetical protein